MRDGLVEAEHARAEIPQMNRVVVARRARVAPADAFIRGQRVFDDASGPEG